MKKQLLQRLSTIGENIKQAYCISEPLVILLGIGVILVVRKTDAFVNPQFWAEDGTVFFLQQYNHGFSAFWANSGGYLHAVPRVVAGFSDWIFPYNLTPLIYNYASFVVTLMVASIILSPRQKQLTNAPLMALSVVLVPHWTNEVFLNITNVQWMLALVLILFWFRDPPHRKYGHLARQYLFDFSIITLCGLTGPFVILFAPVYLWIWFKHKNRYWSVVTLLVVLCAGLQVITLYRAPLQAVTFSFNLKAFSELIGQKLFGALFLGYRLAVKIDPYLLSVLFLGLVLLFFLYACKHKNHFALLSLGAGMIVLLMAYIKFGDPMTLVPYTHGVRYFYIPYVTIAWAMIALLGSDHRPIHYLAAIGLICILISSIGSGFRHNPYTDYHWASYAKLIGQKDIEIPINPPGWKLFVKAQP